MKVNANQKEVLIQNILHKFMSEPSKIFYTKSGKRLQILSPGRLNLNDGPDFIDVAILLNGYVIVGNVEYHKNNSDWKNHKHSNNSNYDNIILHIISNFDEEIDKNFETLVIPYDEIIDKEKLELSEKDKISSIEDLQHFSLMRLLRKSSDAQNLLKKGSIEYSLTELTKNYLEKYITRKRRPSYDEQDLTELLKNITKSDIILFLKNLEKGETISIPDIMQSLIKKPIIDEGKHLRREIILNAVLPIAVCLANEESRINLFIWYWSIPSLNHYGVLKRRFPELPQNYLWQQQGMLEYIKLHGRQTNIATEALHEYSFGEILSFYHQGKSPYFKTSIIES